MNAATTFSAGHDDLIHHISYDYYGTRLATCSSDQRIKVWDLIDDKWTSNDTFKAHDGSVVKLSWAHPEFGQILASGSFDRTVRIWEESQQDERDSGKRWFERTRFSDSKGSVQDVKWAPSFAGLKLAVCEASGVLRIYDCLDPVNMTPWESVRIF